MHILIIITKLTIARYQRAVRRAQIEAFINNRGLCPKNLHILRYAETLLIKAEADNELNNSASAIANLNMVRAQGRIAGYDRQFPIRLKNCDLERAQGGTGDGA